MIWTRDRDPSKEKILVPWDPPGVPRVPILGPNRGMFSKLNWPGPLESGGHSHAIFSNGRFRGAQRSFGGDVLPLSMLGLFGSNYATVRTNCAFSHKIA